MTSSTPPPPHPPHSSTHSLPSHHNNNNNSIPTSSNNNVAATSSSTVHSPLQQQLLQQQQQEDQHQREAPHSQSHAPGSLRHILNDVSPDPPSRTEKVRPARARRARGRASTGTETATAVVVEKKTPGEGSRNAPIIVGSGESGGHHNRFNLSKNFVNGAPEDQGSSPSLPTPSSRKLQRAATLAESPSAGRDLRARAGSFGAGLTRVPPPIHIQGQMPTPVSGAFQDNRVIVQPYQQGNSFGSSHMAAPHQLPVGDPAAIHNTYHNMNPYQQLPGLAPGAYAPLAMNPYALRADEVGPRHGIPGLGSLQGLLTPPGWQPGNPPINEQQANVIYARSRMQAQASLNATAHEFDDLPAEERQRRMDAKNDAWDNSRKLDDALRIERIKIHHAYQAWMHNTMSGAQVPNEISPMWAQPPMTAFQGNPLTPVGLRPSVNQFGLPMGVVPSSPPLSGGHLHSRLKMIQQGFHLPQASPISPSMIDPSLIPQTYESVVHFYNANKAILTQLWTENERYLYVWGTHFNRSMNPQYVREANSVMQGGPGGAVGERREGFSRDQARSSFNAPNRPSQLLQVENVDSRSRVAPVTTGRPAGSSGSVFQFPTSYIRSTRPDLAGHEASNGHGNPREQGTKPAKQASSPSTANSGSWSERYREEIKKANLPPPTLNEDVLRAAGLPVKPNGAVAKPKLVAAVKTKTARGKPTGDPAEGYVISARSARALIAQGATDARNKPMVISTNTQADAHGLSTAGNLSHSPLRREEGPQSLANNVGRSMNATVRDEDEESVEEDSENATESDGSTPRQHAEGQSATTRKPQRGQKSKRGATGSHGLAKKRSKLDADHSDD